MKSITHQSGWVLVTFRTVKRAMCHSAIAMVLFLTVACTTLHEREAEIRTRETILFASRVNAGRILNTDRHISWEQGGVPLLLSPTTIYYGNQTLPIRQVDHVETRDFDHAGEFFLKPVTVEDVLIIRSSLGNFWNGLIFKFPDEAVNGEAVPQRQAEELMELIQQQRKGLDPFGRIFQPRPVWLGISEGEPRAFWQVEPRYLESRYPGKKEAVEKVLKEAGPSFFTTYWRALADTLCREVQPADDTYSFVDMGRIPGLVNHLVKPVKNVVGHRDPDLESIVLTYVPSIWMQEKLDPYGTPSVRFTVKSYVRFMDLETVVTGSDLALQFEAIIPIEELLADSEACLNKAANEAAVQVAASIEKCFTM